MKFCPLCDSECAEKHVFEDIQWGTDGVTKYGRQIFKNIEQRYFECLKCGETFYDMEQAHFREANLNEAIKARLGIDWLAESEARRRGFLAEVKTKRGPAYSEEDMKNLDIDGSLAKLGQSEPLYSQEELRAIIKDKSIDPLARKLASTALRIMRLVKK
jgi:hypothetical protein